MAALAGASVAPGASSRTLANTSRVVQVAADPSLHISNFLSTLALLGLDLEPDWPGIRKQTFAAKDAGQGQKKRIQCAEWALYRLFELWDPEEARKTLQPFFPPLDQVQSMNLRSALLRSLEKVKKLGVLGRDVTLRRTMLDECRGDRLEEVLAVFASAVLRKVVAESPDTSAAVRRIAEGQDGRATDERAQLHLLSIAHRVSLTRSLRDKRTARERFQDFAELLALKERSVARRREVAKAAVVELAALDTPGDEEKRHMREAVGNSWAGNEGWLDSLLYGDETSRGRGLLEMPFDGVWRDVQAGRLSELEGDGSLGLIKQLEDHARMQQQRLQRWEGFGQDTFGKQSWLGGRSKTRSKKSQRLDLAFTVHECLHVDRPGTYNIAQPDQPATEYAGFLEQLRQDLHTATPRTAVRTELVASATLAPDGGVISELSDFDEDDAVPRDALGLGQYDKPSDSAGLHEGTFQVVGQSGSAQASEFEHEVLADAAKPLGTQQRTDDETLLDRSLPPSPVKKPRHTLSLMERTRLSMARRGSQAVDSDEDQDQDEDLMPPPKAAVPAVNTEYEDLAARTRRSLAGFEAARQKAQLERRRSQRKSRQIAPARPDAGGVARVAEEDDAEDADTTQHLADSLLAAGDEEAVFKSRPRVKTSPLGTPIREQD